MELVRSKSVGIRLQSLNTNSPYFKSIKTDFGPCLYRAVAGFVATHCHSILQRLCSVSVRLTGIFILQSSQWCSLHADISCGLVLVPSFRGICRTEFPLGWQGCVPAACPAPQSGGCPTWNWVSYLKYQPWRQPQCPLFKTHLRQC